MNLMSGGSIPILASMPVSCDDALLSLSKKRYKISVWMLLMIPALLAAEVFAVSTRISIKSEDASLCQALASQELVLRNELSYILACVSRGHPGNVFRQIVTVEGQAYGILDFMRFVYLLDLGLLMLLFIFSGLVITYA